MFVPGIVACNSIRKCRFFRKKGLNGFCQLAGKSLGSLRSCPKCRDSPQDPENMTEFFKPSVKACKGCGNLRRRQICAISERMPENLTECPLQAGERKLNMVRENLQEMDRTMVGVCRVSPENSCRIVPVGHFVDALILCGVLNIKFTAPHARKDRKEYQEIISCIVKAARKYGYEIPEAEA